MRSLRTLAAYAGLSVTTGMQVSVKSTLAVDEEILASKNRPVAKVINVLKDMLSEMEKEAQEDEEIYDTMACWCETNDKEKTKAIADAGTKLENLAVKIEEMTALSAKLSTEIKNLEKEVAANQEALDKATDIREKQLAEFNEEEKDLLGSISALKGALETLDKHGASFLQMPAGHIEGIAKGVQRAMTKHADMLYGVFTHKQQRAVAAFIQTAQTPGTDGSYAPASGQVTGILEQMKETFETNLAQTQKDEATNQKAYDDIKGAKTTEITTAQNQIDKKTEERAKADEKNAMAKQDTKDTKASLSADEEFLAMLKEKCAAMDAEWEERQKTRTMEMEACSKALAVLSSDEAHDMFSKTFNFMQTSMMSQKRARAAAVLKAAGMTVLANKVQLDAFEKVKAAISEMIQALTKEKEDEIKHKDFCVEEFNTNALATEKKQREKKDLEVKIEDLDMTVKQLSSDIDKLKAEIAEMAVQMKRAGENREKENKDFQMTVADQRATQKLLNAALEILKGFYGKKNETFKDVTLLQQPAAPPGFSDYSKNKKAGGVQEMIATIIADAKAMENEAIKAESDAQVAYETFVKESNTATAEKEKEATNKIEERAKSEGMLVESTEARDSAISELETLSEANAALHQSCDFVMKNFELRQAARDEEIQALNQATAILSGAKFDDE